MAVSDDVLDAAMTAYGRKAADRERLRRAIAAAVAVAYRAGYQKGYESADYNDTGTPH